MKKIIQINLILTALVAVFALSSWVYIQDPVRCDAFYIVDEDKLPVDLAMKGIFNGILIIDNSVVFFCECHSGLLFNPVMVCCDYPANHFCQGGLHWWLDTNQ